MASNSKDFEQIRQIHTVLMLHYVENQKQADIAKSLNLSQSKVNRLITQGRKMGMVRIDIESPFQGLIEMERELVSRTGLSSSVVTPSVPGSPTATLQQVGRAAASHLVETLRDGDVIAITGGKGVSAVVDSLDPERKFDVTVVPLTGGVQGKYYTDVNHLATQMAERLGGSARLVHAPLFAESREQRDMLMGVSSIKEVLDIARKANKAIVGIGSIEPKGSSYYDLHPVPESDRKQLKASGVVGEFLAHLIHEDGSVADYALNSRLVALPPSDLVHCERVIGVTSGAEKVRPIQAVINGEFVNSIIVDDETASAVLGLMEGKKNVA